MADDNINKVDMVSDEHVQWQIAARLSQTIMTGTSALIAGSTGYNPLTDFLPKEEGESQTSYDLRRSRSKLFNVFKRTIQRLSGEVFRNPVSMSEDMPDVIQENFENIDMAGKNLLRFCIDVFTSGMVDGCSLILVDFPAMETIERDGKTYVIDDAGNAVLYNRDIEKTAGLRPYWTHIKADQILGFKTGMIGGSTYLRQIRILEETEVDTGLYSTEKIGQIRVLEPGKFEVYQQSVESHNWVLVEQGTTSYNFIPLAIWQPAEPFNFVFAKPPLNELAELNLTHFQSSSDQRNILHYARLITFFGKCLDYSETEDEGEFIVGANRLIETTNPEGDLRVIEHSGKAIDAGRNDLKDLENQMAMFGMSLMMSRDTGNVTATQRALDTAENDSMLGQWAMSFQDFINTALSYTGAIMSVEAPGTLSVNTDFRTYFQSEDAELLLKAYEMGMLPADLVMEELKSRGLIGDHWDVVDVRAMLEDDQRRVV